jgi:hypothetical protein
VNENVGEAVANSGRRQRDCLFPFKKIVPIFPSKTERKNESTLFRKVSKIEFTSNRPNLTPKSYIYPNYWTFAVDVYEEYPNKIFGI